MRRLPAALAAAAAVLALTACAPATPIPGSLDDSAFLLPEGQWSPGIGDSDGILLDEDGQPLATPGSGENALGDPIPNHEYSIAGQFMINDPWIGTKPTLSFERVSANCVRDEQSGTHTLQFLNGTPIDLMRIYDGGWSCPSERSWATWRITLKLADGTTATNRLEVRQTNSPGSGTFGMESLCWSEGRLACDGYRSSEIIGGYLSLYVGLVAIGPKDSKACAVEREICQVSGAHDVAFGFNGDYAIKRGASGPVECVAESFDRDPAPGIAKGCFIL
ncbi:MAG: hypothetical protein J7480_06025 [Microbacteriaceae bacterium]|nr:hypothetical protein [Microbacteriaceae bacterium]